MAKIIRVEKSENGNSYQIDFGGTLVWFDTWRDDDGELTGDWNQYIFTIGNEQDEIVRAIQDAHNDECGAYNYMTAIELAEEFELKNK